MPDRATTLQKLDRIRLIAVLDVILLVVLLGFSFSGNERGVSILGPIHGGVVLVLLYLTVVGVGEKRWGWLFPVTTLLPIFALLYDVKLRRQVATA